MGKVIALALVTILLCCDFGSAIDRRLQNANLDFLNFESNNARTTTTQKPSSVVPPNQRQTTGQGTPTSTSNLPKGTTSAGTTTTAKPGTTGSTIAAGSLPSTKPGSVPTSNVRQIVNKFNENDRQNGPTPTQPKSPTQTTAPGQRPILPNVPGNPTQPKSPTQTTAPGQRPVLPNVPGNPTQPPKDAYPALPAAGGTTKPTPPPPRSWAGVVAGNNKGSSAPQPTPTVGGAKLPTPQQNIPGYPPLPPPGSTTTNTGPEIATDKELKDTSEAIFKKESNSLAKHFTINYQGKTSSFSKDDQAPQPLVSLKPEIWNEPTVAAMKALLDNYEQDTTVNEFVTPQEKNEENTFLDLVMATPVMRQLMTFLKEKEVVSQDPKQQRDFVKQIWFNMYSRGQGRIGSSGFEHIFLSEIKNNEVSGLHNWLYFGTEEAANRANYLGYMKKLDLSEKSAVLKSHFSLDGIDKPVNTMFVGTSPELEMALYTLCFATRVDKSCPLSLGGKEFNLRTHNYRYRSKNMIGSAFPEI